MNAFFALAIFSSASDTVPTYTKLGLSPLTSSKLEISVKTGLGVLFSKSKKSSIPFSVLAPL